MLSVSILNPACDLSSVLLQILRQEALECVRSAGHARAHKCAEVGMPALLLVSVLGVVHAMYMDACLPFLSCTAAAVTLNVG